MSDSSDLEKVVAALDASKIQSDIDECRGNISRLEADFASAVSLFDEATANVASASQAMDACEAEAESYRSKLEELLVDLQWAESEAA